MTVRESPLHRLFDTASIRVDSAGGDGGEGGAAKRESLAPIVKRADLPRLLAEVLPDVDVAGVTWCPVDPRGFRRALKSSLILAVLLTAAVHPHAQVVDVRLAGGARRLGVAARAALREAPRMGRRRAGGAVQERVAVAASSPSRASTRFRPSRSRESPFDRRARMASVRVDTAGAGDASHRVDIPYLARSTADDLYRRLAGEAARTAFRW